MIRSILKLSESNKVSYSWLLHCRTRAKTCIGVSCNMVCLLSVLLKPYMPETADIMAAQVNAPSDLFVLSDNIYQTVHPGHQIGKVKYFPCCNSCEHFMIVLVDMIPCSKMWSVYFVYLCLKLLLILINWS